MIDAEFNPVYHSRLHFYFFDLPTTQMLKRLAIILIAFGLLQAWPGILFAQPAIKVGVYQNKPSVFIDSNGQPRGIFIDILDHIAQKEGWRLKYVPGTWSDCLQRLRDGEIDLLAGIAFSKKSTTIYDFNYETVLTNWAQIYTPRGSHIETFLDLADKKIAVKKDDIHFLALRKLIKGFGIECRFIEAEGYQTIFELLENNKVKAGLVNRLYGFENRRNFNVNESRIVFNPIEMRYATPKDANLGLLLTIDDHLKKLKNNEHSVYHQSISKWLMVGSDETFPKWFAWTIFGAGAMSVFLIAASIFFKFQVRARTADLVRANRKLNEEIHERKLTEEALKTSNKRYQLLFESAADGIYVHDFKGRILDVNKVYCNRLGYSRDEFLQMNIKDILVPEIAALFEDRAAKLYQIGQMVFESSHRRKDGTYLPVEASTRKIEFENQPAVLSIMRDISKRKLAEQKNEELFRQLQRTQKMEAVGALAGGIAHDFNNILFPIIGYVELALEDLPDNPAIRANLRQVLTAAKRAKNLVQQILAYSRQSEQELMPLRIQVIIKEVLKLTRSSLPSTIEIHQDIDNRCDPVMADPTQIHQIAMNLVTNAFHAMELTGGHLKVSVSEVEIVPDDADHPYLAAGRYACLTVADTGQGMPQKVMDRIFDPYFTTKDKSKGTGLGLSVVHGIVKSNSGEISVTSVPGKGSQFKVYLPTMDRITESPVIKPKLHHHQGHGHILVVDDEEQIVLMLQEMLHRSGYEVTIRTSSVEALKLFREKPRSFDLVISDQTMPNMTGDRLTAEIKKISPDIPVMLCTGFSETITADKAEAIGIDAFIMKPVVRMQMIDTIHKVLHNKRAA